MSADCTVGQNTTRRRSFLKSFHSVSCYGATALGRSSCGTGGMRVSGQQCFRLPFFPRCVPPEVDPTGRASSSNAGPISSLAARALTLLPPWLLRLRRHLRSALQDVKRTNEGASEHTYLANGADRTPRVLRPKNLADEKVGDDDGQSETTSVLNRWLSFLLLARRD